MKYSSIIKAFAFMFTLVLFTSCNSEEKSTEETKKQPGIKTENVTYSSDTVTMNGYVAYDSSITTKRPIVLIIHEWWGLNDYAKQRARQLAELGYVAFAVDMFGSGKTADNPTDAQALAGPFYQNPDMARTRFEAALAKAKLIEQGDADKIASMGYCFGGGLSLAMARMGLDLDGVVSFHGNLTLGPSDKNLLKAKILVCHGAADPMVPQTEVDQFKKTMDSLGADYTFKAYPGALHAFTNPNATAIGQKYNIPIAYDAAADSASWNEMKNFFERIF
jgi:dienelactone hydrolase